MLVPAISRAWLAAVLLLAAPLSTLAQSVGIGTTTPNASAVLDLTATDKGLLIPRLDSVARVGIAAPPDGLMVFQTDGRKGFWYAMNAAWLFIPDKTRSGDNLGNHTATKTLDLNDERLTGSASSPLGDSTAQVQIQSTVPSKSVAFITRSYYGRHYTRTMLSGYGTGPYGQDIDYAVWGNAYRSDGWAGIFTAGRPGQPLRWVGLAGHPGYINANSAIRIVDGTQGAGRVLTSDAVGNGKWMPITAAGGNFNLGTYSLVGNGGSTGLAISSAGRVGIGTTAPRGTLDVANGDTYLVADPANGNAQSLYLPGYLFLAPYSATDGTAYVQARVPNPSPSTAIALQFRTTNNGQIIEALRLNPSGSATFQGNVTANGVTLTSDARFKTDVCPLTGTLAAVQALRGVRYRWNALGIRHGGQPDAEQVGLLAQELEKVYPELVRTDELGYKSVNYAQLTPVLIEALKELAARNAALETRVAEQQHALQTQQASTVGFEQRLRALEAGGARAEAGK